MTTWWMTATRKPRGKLRSAKLAAIRPICRRCSSWTHRKEKWGRGGGDRGGLVQRGVSWAIAGTQWRRYLETTRLPSDGAAPQTIPAIQFLNTSLSPRLHILLPLVSRFPTCSTSHFFFRFIPPRFTAGCYHRRWRTRVQWLIPRIY